MKKHKSGTYAKMPLNYEELRAFIDTIVNPEYRLMVALIVAGFLRVGEVTKMRKGDIMGKNIMVRKTKCRNDKNGRPIKPYREVPMPGWVRELADEVLPLLSRSKDDLLFQHLRGGGGLTVGGVNNRLDVIFSKFDHDQKVTCHSLRKTAAVRLYENSGNDLRMVQIAADHASIATSGIYVLKGRADFEEKYKAAFA